MVRYHINPETGNPGACTARYSCPFGAADAHYNSEAEARHAYEQNMPALRPSMKKLTRESLKSAILEEVRLSDSELERLAEAIELADILHDGQIRKAAINGRTGTPYIEHPLRNTLRLVRLGVTDVAVLNAAVLHDTAEDCAERFCELRGVPYADAADARDKLLKHIEVAFDERTKELVLSVTNRQQKVKPATTEEKNRVYQNDVAEEIGADPDTYLIKWADVVDNAGSLHHARPHEIAGAKKQATKYLPTIPFFLESLEVHSAHYPPDVQVSLRERMLKIEDRLKDILTWPTPE